MDDYRVRLECFEGPMDLLVFLIRKHEIDIYDIPIALIADQYLEYARGIEALDLEQAGDFLLMAATLLQIKSRLLLPRPEGADEEWEDPRTELVEKILEYMQFKEIADRMRQLEERSGSQAERGFSEVELYRRQEEEEPEVEATVHELILAFSRMLERRPPPEPVHRVPREKVTSAGRAADIRRLLAHRRRVLFSELFQGEESRLYLVVTLVALLEMAKGGEIAVEQESLFGEIFIGRRKLRRPVTDGREDGEPGEERAASEDLHEGQ